MNHLSLIAHRKSRSHTIRKRRFFKVDDFLLVLVLPWSTIRRFYCVLPNRRYQGCACLPLVSGRQFSDHKVSAASDVDK